MTIKHSDTLSKFAPAFVAAQKKVEHATKNAQNPHLKNKYANLAEVIDTVTPTFNDEGLAILQFPGWNEGRATVSTMVLHTSGEFVAGTAECPLPKADPQGYGAATTYLRRYGGAAVANISQEDDDGESALNRKPKGEKTAEADRKQAAEVAKDPESPQALYNALQAEIGQTRDWAPGEVKTLQARIRTLHGQDKKLGVDAYQLARKAGIVE